MPGGKPQSPALLLLLPTSDHLSENECGRDPGRTATPPPPPQRCPWPHCLLSAQQAEGSSKNLSHNPKEFRDLNRHVHTHVRAALGTVARKWEQPTCPLTDERTSKVWSVHTAEYHSALKRERVLTPATTRRGREDVTPSGRRPVTKRQRAYKSTDIDVPRGVKFTETGSQMGAAKDGGGCRGEMGTQVQFGKVRKFWRGMAVMVGSLCECTQCP